MSRVGALLYCRLWLLSAWLFLGGAMTGRTVILWSDLGTTRAHENGMGVDILGGTVKADDTSSNVLYFKFHVDPFSDVSVEPYLAGFQLFEKGQPRLGVGNTLKAWAYSAFNTGENETINREHRSQSWEYAAVNTNENNTSPRDIGDTDLRSSRPERAIADAFFPYELVRRGIESTIVFKVQYVPGQDDIVTVWLNPDLTPGATEENQKTNLTTSFRANASFDEIHLRHAGGGAGWDFSGMAIATSFNDFINGNVPDAEAGHAATLPFTFRSWQREQGLPQNSVRALAQTKDGYLWVGSDDGVARFDGVRFVPYGSRAGLRGGPVRALLGDSHGGLWIGSEGGGLTHLEPGKSTAYTIRNGLPGDSVNAVAEDNESRIWVGTEAGLAVWQEKSGVFETNQPLRGKTITTLFNDTTGRMWVGVRGVGIFHFEDGKAVLLQDPTSERLLQDPHSLIVDRAGRLWIGTGDDRVLCRDGNQWLRYRIPHHLPRPYIVALAETADGTVWAGSVSEGLFEFKSGQITPINASTGLADNLVESLLVDQEGKLWVGTDAGLSRLRPKSLLALEENEGLDYGPVQGLAEVAPGVVWAGKPGGGLYRYDGKMFTRLSAPTVLGAEPQVNALLLAQDGSCWVASARGLLHFKQPEELQPESEPVSLVGLNVLSLAQDAEGDLWAGTRNGQLWRFHSGSWSAQPSYWQGHAVTAIVQDHDGWMWLGTEGDGLYRIKGNAHVHLKKMTGGLESDLIRALQIDSEGVVWIGTAGGGLTRYAGAGVRTFTTREGLPDNTISQILEDDAGRLWLGSDRGIASVSKHDLAELASGRIHTVYPQVYGRAEGMLSEECTGRFCPAGLKTKSGHLWFSTLKGVVVADPRRMAEVPPPKVLLEEVLLDSDLIPSAPESQLIAGSGPRGIQSVSQALTIPPGRHRLEVRYTGLSFNAPERIRFRYQLEGLDPDWVEAPDSGTRRTASYNYVPPGQYHFRVIACNSDGVWNQAGASLSLKALPHFWQTWWFIGLASVLLLLSVGGSVRFVENAKIHRRLTQLEQERALQRERARIARDLHDDLGSSLTRISLLSGLTRADKDNPGLVENHAIKLSQSAAQTVRALEEIVWAVRPGSDSLQSLLEYIAHFSNELFEGDNARCRLIFPQTVPARPLPPELRHDIFLIVKEALTNVLKHASAKEVRLQAKVAVNSLEILVQDDGKGFDSAQPQSGERNGLGNMRRRAEAMAGTLAIQSWPGKGTAVCLTVKLPSETADLPVQA